MSFCPECGAKNNMRNKFCSNCGNRLQTQTGAVPRAPAGEQIIAAMSGLSQGLLRRSNHVMLITGERLIFVRLSDEDRSMIINSMTDKAKNEGAGFLGRIAASIGANYNLGDYFIGWSPQQVSARFNDFRSVSAHDVRELRIKTRNSEYDNDYEMRVKATGFNEKFTLSSYQKEEHQALKRLLGSRVKSNTWFF